MMEIQQIQKLLKEVHSLEGLLLQCGFSGTVAEGFEAELRVRIDRLTAMLADYGLMSAPAPEADDISRTLAAMYEEKPIEDDGSVVSVPDMNTDRADRSDEADEEVKPIVSSAYGLPAGAGEPLPDSLTPPSDDDDEACYRDEEADDLEILEEDDEEADGGDDLGPDLAKITINERARFRNNLFDGSMARFDEVMNFLLGLRSFSEAEDYLCNDLEMNPEADDIAAEFIDKIRDCFHRGR